MKFFRGRVSLFAASVLVLVLAAPAFPQALTGGINGTSTDASGALIPGVEVTVASPAMIEGSRSAITNETGSYRFPLLPPGSYTVTFMLPGFATLNIEDVVVPVGTTMTINGTLEVATVRKQSLLSARHRRSTCRTPRRPSTGTSRAWRIFPTAAPYAV